MITVRFTTLEQTKQGYPVYLYINIIEYDRDKVDEANRKVIDYINTL